MDLEAYPKVENQWLKKVEFVNQIEGGGRILFQADKQ